MNDTDLTTVTLSLDTANLTNNLATVLHGNDTPESLPRATTDIYGALRLATSDESVAATSNDTAVTPDSMQQAFLAWMRDTVGTFPSITPPGLNLFCGAAIDDTVQAGTFTRSTTATRMGQGRLVETMAAGDIRREWGQDGKLRGWRLEAQATNLLTYSQALDDSSWVKVLASLTANAAIAPDGTMSAGKIIPNETYSSSHSVYHAVATEIGTTYTFSTFAKSDEYKYIGISLYDTSSQLTIFDLTNSLVISGAGSIEYFGNGWYRCSVHFEATKTTCYGRIYIFSTASISGYTGDNISGLYLWGGQVEAGSMPTSYIPTTGAAVARSSDVWTVSLATSWFNMTEGSTFLAARTPANPPSEEALQVLAQYDDGTTSNHIRIIRNADRHLHCVVTVEGNELTNLDMGTAADLTDVRIAFSWSASVFSASLNGNTSITGTTATLPSGLTTHRLGSDTSGGSQWSGHVLHVASFPAALTPQQLQTITR